MAMAVLGLVKAHSDSVILAWDPSTGTNVIGYNIYYGLTSQAYSVRISEGNVTNCTVSGLVPGTTYYFAATAYDSQGLESAFSNEISYTVPTNNLSSLVSQPEQFRVEGTSTNTPAEP